MKFYSFRRFDEITNFDIKKWILNGKWNSYNECGNYDSDSIREKNIDITFKINCRSLSEVQIQE